MIHKNTHFSKPWLKVTLVSVVAFSIAAIAYNTSRIVQAQKAKTPITIHVPNEATGGLPEAQNAPISSDTEQEESVQVIVSKRSKSGAYHYPWCPGAKQIKESNKLSFQSAAIAEAAGYHLAGNCEAR